MIECFCDYDPPVFYHAARPVARKAHKCDECGNAISPGEAYERVHAKWEYVIDTCRTCARCLALRDFVRAHIPCFCWAHNNMLSDAHEHIEQFAHEAPGLFMGYGRLRVAIRRGGKAC